jgi:D-3-phosphoglycerate dehydrogenase / 2-oxoglutarate reductase
MRVYSLTTTLDEYVDFYTSDPLDAEVLVVGGSKIQLSDFPNLKYIFKCGVGVDNIPDLSNTDIQLIMPSQETKNCIFDEVSSFTINLILQAHYRNSGDVKTWTKIERKNLTEKNAVVIGVGNIGSLVYTKLHSMTNVTSFDPIVISDWNTLENAILNNDIITLHCPLTENNKNMIDVNWLRPDCILVNTSRAELIDEDDLYNFLRDNPKATAAFDVFWKEPYAGKLLELDNFIATPHIASFGSGFKRGLYLDLLKLVEH